MIGKDESPEPLEHQVVRLKQRIAELEASVALLSSDAEALQHSRSKCEAILHSFDGLIYVCSSNYRVEYANERFIERTGYDPVGETCYGALHAREEVCPWCMDARVFRGETVHVEVRSPKDDRWYTIACAPIRRPDGSVSTIAIVRDITAGKEMGESLRTTKERFEALLNATTEMSALIAADGTFLALNESVADMLGDTIANLIGKSALGLLPPDLAPESGALLDLLVQTGNPVRFDYQRAGRYFDVNCHPVFGSRREVESVAVFVRDTSGELAARLELHKLSRELERCIEGRTAERETTSKSLRHEIAEHTRCEVGLRDSEERFRALAERTSDWVWEMDAGGTYSYAGPKIKDLLGYEPDEVLGKTMFDFMLSDRAEDAALKFKRIFASGKPFERLEKVNVHKCGRLIVLETSGVPIFDSENRIRGYRGVDRDVTERKRAEETPAEIEERFRTIAEVATDYIFVKDRSLRYTYVNPAIERLLDLSASRILGRTYEDLFGHEGAEQIRDVDARVLEGQSVESESTKRIRGRRMTFHEVRVPVRDRSGMITGLCGISRDVTERWRADRPAGLTLIHYPSEAMRATLKHAHYAASGEGIVLLLGESGSGKDHLARWIHSHSRRSNGPYFAINCAAIPKELAESELFGHEAGAFTGARGRKRGLLQLAEDGTLLLNEIGELSLELQAKLLSFLDTRSFVRVGGQKTMQVNARIMAATNRNLQKDMAEGRFLEALFYRLNVFCIRVPSLRDRIEDLPLLVEEILADLSAELQLAQAPVLDPADLIALAKYEWPGNVRELRNVLERALMLWDREHPEVPVPPPSAVAGSRGLTVRLPSDVNLHQAIDEVTECLCREALQRCGGNKSAAARLLGICRDSLYQYMSRYGINRPDES